MAIDPTLVTASLAALEKAINAALQYDPGTKQQLASFHNVVIKIESTAPEFCLYVLARDHKVCIQSYCSAEPDASISGPLMQLLALSSSSQYSLANTPLRTGGNLQTLEHFQALIRGLDIDWEAITSNFTGDMLAHQLANMSRSIFAWGKTNTGKFTPYMIEFLQEELKIIPSHAEITPYSEAVDELRAATARLSARTDLFIKTVNRSQQS